MPKFYVTLEELVTTARRATAMVEAPNPLQAAVQARKQHAATPLPLSEPVELVRSMHHNVVNEAYQLEHVHDDDVSSALATANVPDVVRTIVETLRDQMGDDADIKVMEPVFIGRGGQIDVQIGGPKEATDDEIKH